MNSAKFRKRPVVIDAIRNTDPFDIIRWMAGAGPPWGAWQEDGAVMVNTLEGTMKCAPGDWMIRGVKGEFYPCKPDIFEATYEPVAVEEARNG